MPPFPSPIRTQTLSIFDSSQQCGKRTLNEIAKPISEKITGSKVHGSGIQYLFCMKS